MNSHISNTDFKNIAGELSHLLQSFLCSLDEEGKSNKADIYIIESYESCTPTYDEIENLKDCK